MGYNTETSDPRALAGRGSDRQLLGAADMGTLPDPSHPAYLRGIAAADAAMALRPQTPPDGYVPPPQRVIEGRDLESDPLWRTRSFVVDDPAANEIIDRFYSGRLCTICMKPMIAGQHGAHFTCRDNAEVA